MGEGKQAPARHCINFALMIARNRNSPISTIVSPAYIQQFEVVTVMTDSYRVG
jgi:hypothetical protein